MAQGELSLTWSGSSAPSVDFSALFQPHNSKPEPSTSMHYFSALRISTDTLLLTTVVPRAVPGPEEEASPGSILEMQAQESHPNLLNQKLYNRGSSDCVLISSPGHSVAH